MTANAPATDVSRTSDARPRLDWVDGLRGIASLAVTLFHGMIFTWIGLVALQRTHAGTFDRIVAYLSIPVHYGYFGVMLFFVLSGFVIHLPYANARKRFDFAPYIVRRTLRIYPPYLVALLASFVIATFVRTDRNITPDGDIVVRAIFFLQNYPHLGGKYSELAWLQPAGNISFWSLPVEFELYLAYPILLWLIRRFSVDRAILVVAGVSIVATIVDIAIAAPVGKPLDWANYVPTFLRYWVVWSAGAWLSERLMSGRIPTWNVAFTVGYLALLALSLVQRFAILPYDVGDLLLGAFFVMTVLLVIDVQRTRPERIAFLGGPMAKLGDFSYSLYLIHMPCFLIAATLWYGRHGSLPTNYLFSVVVAAAIVPIAYLFWRAIEDPSVRIGKFLAARLEKRPLGGPPKSASVPATSAPREPSS